MKPLHYYFVGSGSWYLAYGIQGVVFAWLVTIILNESPDKVGIAQMAYLLPGTFLILIGGSLADHFGGRRLALLGQSFAAITAAGLALTLALTELSYSLFLFFAVAMGCAQAIVTPARDGLLTLVAEGRIQRRVMQASMIQFGIQTIGFLISSLADTVGAMLMLSFQSFVLSIGALAYYFLDVPQQTPSRTQLHLVSQLFDSIRDGYRSVRNSPAMQTVVLQNCAMGILFMGSFIVTLPLLIREVYNGSSMELSWINTVNSFGLLVTIVLLFKFGDVKLQGRALIISQGFGALVLACASLNFGFSILIVNLFCWGLCGGVAMTMSRTIMQEHSPEDQRGRMMAFYGFSFMGSGPIGAVLCGYLVTWFGASMALAIAASLMFLVVILVYWKSSLWDLHR
ncbi:MAG: MFS transporter [Gammaproteobacteria bacterium]|jgi:MFS family permease|nr:MFS transporter [Gammaproteobacteria bacterium]MBT5602104.1 MFS transporter [Gammaproteobacteria bacterium]MBT6245010.1 MFS transporter [Gammaproteobacteria bacterium]